MTAILVQFAPLVLILVFFYFILIRPQKKKDAQIREMRDNLKVGDRVLTIGGMIGKIVLIKEDYLVLETSSDKSKIEIMKWGINTVIKSTGDLKAEPEAK